QLDWIIGGSASGGTAAFLGVWNAYNRVSTGVVVTDSGTSYTYTSSTIRQARASAGNQVTFVSGLAEDSPIVSYGQRIDTVAASGAGAGFGVGLDSTTTYLSQRASINAIGTSAAISAVYITPMVVPQLGVHIVSANENSDATNANTFNGGAATGGGGILNFQFRM